MENFEVENPLISKEMNHDVTFKSEEICIINEELNTEELHPESKGKESMILEDTYARVPSEEKESMILEDTYARVPGAKKHNIERRYSCPYCSLRLVSRSNLHTHIRIHTGSQPFLCNICGKVENTKFNLDRHAQSHFHICDYMCGDCEKSFRSLFAVRRHIKNVHQKHVREVDHFRIKKKIVRGQEMMFIKAVHKNSNYYKLFHIINETDNISAEEEIVD